VFRNHTLHSVDRPRHLVNSREGRYRVNRCFRKAVDTKDSSGDKGFILDRDSSNGVECEGRLRYVRY